MLSHCNCKAGLSGVCSHVGGLLLVLSNIKTACTSVECRWDRPPRRPDGNLQPQRVEDIILINTENVDKRPPKKAYPGTYQAGPCNDPDAFLSDLLKGLGDANPGCVLYQTLCAKPANVDNILNKFSIDFQFVDSVDLTSQICKEQFDIYIETLQINDQDAKAIEQAAYGQSYNTNWQSLRQCLLTSSNFGVICKMRKSTAPDNLVSRLCGYNPWPEGIASLKHGRRNEEKARRAYAQHHMKECGSEVK